MKNSNTIKNAPTFTMPMPILKNGCFPRGLSPQEISGDELSGFKDFNVDCEPQIVEGKKQRTFNSDGIRVPLWKIVRDKKSEARASVDHIKPGISTQAPGENSRSVESNGTTSFITGRADDLARFYATQPDCRCGENVECTCNGESAFDLEGDEDGDLQFPVRRLGKAPRKFKKLGE